MTYGTTGKFSSETIQTLLLKNAPNVAWSKGEQNLDNDTVYSCTEGGYFPKYESLDISSDAHTLILGPGNKTGLHWRLSTAELPAPPKPLNSDLPVQQRRRNGRRVRK
jgi:hypothetical protein